MPKYSRQPTFYVLRINNKLRSLGIIYLFLFVCCRDSGSSQQKEWKPYGTPLVSPISCEDTVTSGDIQSAVQTLLSPMLKVKTENVRHSDISNVSAPASDPPPAVNNSAGATNDCILADLKQECGNSKVITSHRLPLQLVDENNACIDLSIGEEKAFKIPSSSRAILVFIDWSHKLLDNYESTCLENLPDVKNGAVTKKTRNEPLSLYTCLEAFLREEPLVPEDMWLVLSYFLHCFPAVVFLLSMLW